MAQNFSLKENNMATRHKLNLINGTIDTEGDIRTYTATNSSELQ